MNQAKIQCILVSKLFRSGILKGMQGVLNFTSIEETMRFTAVWNPNCFFKSRQIVSDLNSI